MHVATPERCSLAAAELFEVERRRIARGRAEYQGAAFRFVLGRRRQCMPIQGLRALGPDRNGA